MMGRPPKNGIPGFVWNAKAKTARFNLRNAATGVRKRATVKAGSYVEALAKYDAIKAELFAPPAAPAAEPDPPKTFAWYIETYWPAIQGRLPERTARLDDMVVRRRLLPHFGPMLLDALTLADIEDFVGKMKREGYDHELVFVMRGRVHQRRTKGAYSPATINGTLQVLRKILRDAKKRRVIRDYPLEDGLPRVKEKPLELEMKGDELARFLGAFDDEAGFRAHVEATRSRGRVLDFNVGKQATHVAGAGRRPDSEATGEIFARFRATKPLFVVALETGLSRCDLLGLKWTSIDLDRGVIRTRRGKTGVPAIVAISPACLEAVKEVSDAAGSARSSSSSRRRPTSRPTPRRASSGPSSSRRSWPASPGAFGSTTYAIRTPRGWPTRG